MENGDKDIPHGHGMSYRKGVASALLKNDCQKLKEALKEYHRTHDRSFNRGVAEGQAFIRGVAYGLLHTPEGHQEPEGYEYLGELLNELKSSATNCDSFEDGRPRGEEWKQEIAKRVK